MSRPDWPKNWQSRPKHRKATTRTWDSGEALKWSERIGSQSQYNPWSYGSDDAVLEIELHCIDEGEEIIADGSKRTFS